MTVANIVKCPWCAEDILPEAKKCKHCGEFLPDPHGEVAAPETTEPVWRMAAFGWRCVAHDSSQCEECTLKSKRPGPFHLGAKRGDVYPGPKEKDHAKRGQLQGVPAPTRSAQSSVSGELLAMAAAVVGGLVGLALPWFKTIAPFLGQISITGLDTDDGKIIGGAFLVLALFAFFEYRTPHPLRRWLLILGFIAITGVVAYDYSEAAKTVAEFDSDYASVAFGPGLYLSGGAAAFGALAAIGRMLTADRK